MDDDKAVRKSSSEENWHLCLFFFLFSFTLVSKLGAVNLKVICKHTEYSILIFLKEDDLFFFF